MSYELSQEAVSFFMHSYFGITLDELNGCDKDAVLTKCAQRAYLDMCRTLEFTEEPSTGKQKEIQESHREFRDEICEVIKEQIQGLLKADKSSFDSLHRIACEKEITANANKSTVLSRAKDAQKKFHDGQSQKWLNMTMKYMWLTGLWKNEFERLMPVIHIPVDSFIIEAIWHEGFEEDEKGRLIDIDDLKKLSVELPCDNKKRRYKYADYKIKPWSQWDYDEYETFCTTLRAWCEEQKNICPLLWEGQAWIKIANKRKVEKEKQNSTNQ